MILVNDILCGRNVESLINAICDIVDKENVVKVMVWKTPYYIIKDWDGYHIGNKIFRSMNDLVLDRFEGEMKRNSPFNVYSLSYVNR